MKECEWGDAGAPKMENTATGRSHQRMRGLNLNVPLVNPNSASRLLEISSIAVRQRTR
jgi:hypothetical protein